MYEEENRLAPPDERLEVIIVLLLGTKHPLTQHTCLPLKTMQHVLYLWVVVAKTYFMYCCLFCFPGNELVRQHVRKLLFLSQLVFTSANIIVTLRSYGLVIVTEAL